MLTESLRFAGVLGVGSAVPDRILTNADLEKLVDTSDEWIRTRTGIRERRVAAPEVATSDLAAVAGRRAIEDAGLLPSDIGGTIVATVTPDMQFPATACIVQGILDLPNGPAFDISAGCSGFVYALGVARDLVAAGSLDNVLVIGADILTRVVDWSDRSTCVLFGDAAGAVVVSRTERPGILSYYLGADGKRGDVLTLPGGGSRHGVSAQTIAAGLHWVHMDGREVFKFAVRVMVTPTTTASEMAGIAMDDVDLFIPHQANTRIISAAAQRLGLPDDRVFVNAEKYGNTSAASIPLALDEAYRQGRLAPGDHCVTVGFGAGLTWGAAAMQWLK